MGLGSKTPTNKTTPTAPHTSNITAIRIARFLFTAGIGFLMIINVQPWLELSKAIAKQITTIPFLDSLVAIPLLGGWIEWIFANIIPILGCILWAIVQLIEVMPMLADSSVPANLKERLEGYRWVAYAIETIVCFLRYPPYNGGMAAVLEDAPNWDASLIDWWNLVFFLVTMFGFELCFRVVVTVWQGVKFVKPIAHKANRRPIIFSGLSPARLALLPDLREYKNSTVVAVAKQPATVTQPSAETQPEEEAIAQPESTTELKISDSLGEPLKTIWLFAKKKNDWVTVRNV